MIDDRLPDDDVLYESDDNAESNAEHRAEEDADKGAIIGGVGGALVGGVVGAMTGPVGAAIGAAVGGVMGAVGGGAAVAAVERMDNGDAGVGTGEVGGPEADAGNEDIIGRGDIDPRTSDVGLTSVGATDLDADAAVVPPPDAAGVRTDHDPAPADTSENRDILGRSANTIAGDETDQKTGRDVAATINAGTAR